MNIFNTITQAAATAPAFVPAPASAVAFNGAVLEPSPGWQPAVTATTKTLKGYQAAAVETILDIHPRVVLGYEPGMGKTLIMQTVSANQVARGVRVINIVPPSLRVSPWAEDYASDFPGLSVTHVEGMAVCEVCGKANAARIHGTKKVKGDHNFVLASTPIPDADVAIVPDSVLQSRLQDLLDWAAKGTGQVMVTIDEAQRFKNRTSKRTIAALALTDSQNVVSVVAATGTIADNHAGDVYAPLRITGRNNAKAVSRGDSWTRFMDEWCETEMVFTGRAMVKVVKGCSDPVGLRNKLLSTCMLSVPRSQVLDLPARTWPVRNLMVNGDAATYRRMERDFLAWVRDTRGDAAYKRAKKAEAISKMMQLWREDGMAKVNAAAEYIENLTDQDEQVVVMAWHTDVIANLYAALTKKGITVSTVIGGMTADQKADVVSNFQAGKVQVVLGQIRAAGTGLTLTAASNIVFVQLPWAPGTFAQACDRIYRIGQENHCNFHILNGVGMVSQRLWETLQNKASITDAINTGVESTVEYESIQEAVLSGYGW